MDPMLDEFRRLAGSVTFQPPQVPLISNLTGRFFHPGEVPNADYWTRHARQTVRYYAGWQALWADGFRVFLEVGPRPILTDLGRRYGSEAGQWLASSQPKQEQAALLDSLAALYVQGCPIAWKAVYPRRQHQPAVLPTYPFERKRYWIDAPAAAPERPAEHTLAGNNGSRVALNTFVDVVE
jgi:acyl transferase domain-containing protein